MATSRKAGTPYEIVYVRADATTVSKTVIGAPRPERVFTTIRGFTGYTGKSAESNAIFATRYFPSKKAWGVYDMRKFVELTLQTGKRIIKCPRPEVFVGDRDAAIMWATLNL